MLHAAMSPYAGQASRRFRNLWSLGNGNGSFERPVGPRPRYGSTNAQCIWVFPVTSSLNIRTLYICTGSSAFDCTMIRALPTVIERG